MALNAHKTEHRGPKMGRGAYYGRKAAAKRDSNRQRRRHDKEAVEVLDDDASGGDTN